MNKTFVRGVPNILLFTGSILIVAILYLVVTGTIQIPGTSACFLCNVPSQGFILSYGDVSIINGDTDNSVARFTITPDASAGGEYGIISLKKSLIPMQLGNNILPNNVNVGIQTYDERCSYPITKEYTGGRFQPKVANVIPILLTNGNTNDILCKSTLLISGPVTISQPTSLTYQTTPVTTTDICKSDFISKCVNDNQGTVLTSTVGVTKLPFGYNVGGTTGYVCYNIENDISKLYSYYTSNTLNKHYTGNILIDGAVGSETVQVSNFNGQLTSTSPDGQVTATLSNIGFVPLIGKECDQPNTFVIYKTNIGDVYKVSSYSPQSFSSCSNYDTVLSCQQKVSSYNAIEASNLISKSTKISSTSTGSVTFPTSNSGTYDDIRVSQGNKVGNIAFYPVVKVEANGKFLGILRPEPKPIITVSPSSVTVMSATNVQTVTATIVNTGPSGAIAISTNCPFVSITPQVGSNGITLSQGQSTTIPYSVSSTANIGTYSCTLTAAASNGKNPSSATFTVNVKQECQLTPYGSCSVNSDCTGYISVLKSSDCPYGITGTCDGHNSAKCNSNPECQPSPSSKTNAYWDKNACSWYCNPGFKSNFLQNCIPDSTCTTDVTKVCSSDNTTITLLKCNNGILQETGEKCSEPSTCQAKVEATTCGLLDVGCEINKGISRIDCMVQDLIKGIITATTILCIGGSILIGLIIFAILYTRPKGGKHK